MSEARQGDAQGTVVESLQTLLTEAGFSRCEIDRVPVPSDTLTKLNALQDGKAANLLSDEVVYYRVQNPLGTFGIFTIPARPFFPYVVDLLESGVTLRNIAYSDYRDTLYSECFLVIYPDLCMQLQGRLVVNELTKLHGVLVDRQPVQPGKPSIKEIEAFRNTLRPALREAGFTSVVIEQTEVPGYLLLDEAEAAKMDEEKRKKAQEALESAVYFVVKTNLADFGVMCCVGSEFPPFVDLKNLDITVSDVMPDQNDFGEPKLLPLNLDIMLIGEGEIQYEELPHLYRTLEHRQAAQQSM